MATPDPQRDRVTTIDASIAAYGPGDESPTLTVPKGDIASVEYSERIGHRKDDGTITLHNHDRQYLDAITSGDKLEFRVALNPPVLSPWGSGRWGERPLAGERVQWTALVRDVDHSVESPPRAQLELTCEDFVFGVMSEREVYAAFTDEPIAVILQRILNENAPELSVAIPNQFLSPSQLGQTTTVSFDGTNLLDAVDQLCAQADAVARAYRDGVRFSPFDPPEPQFTVTPADVGPVDRTDQDDGLVNVVRVDGARSRALDEDASHIPQSGYETASEDRRMIWQVPTRKSEIDTLELWIRSTSEAGLTVRLQKDDDGQPVNASDRSSDIARRTLSHEFLADDGWTEFLMPEHTLPEPNPWVLIETDGEEQQFGVGPRGGVTRRVYYPFPIAVQSHDTASMAEYRRRETSTEQSEADATEARAVADEILTRNAVPDRVATCDAESRRMQMLRPGETVQFDFSRDGVVGEYIVTERTDSYDGAQLESSITAQDISTV